MTLSRKDASNIFVRKLFEMRKQIGVFVEYEAFDVRIEKLVNELHSSIQLEEHNANKKKKMLKNARNIHPPSGHHNPNQAPPRANKPKLKKQRSVDFTEAEQTGNVVVEEKPLKSIEKDGYKVKSLIDKFEKKIKTVANYVINKARDKTRERVIGKRKSKLSTLRKENKNRSIKQVNAFLNDTFHNPVVLVSVNSMFDTSHLDANMLIKHSMANGGTPSVKRPYIINHKLMQHHHSQNQKKMQELKMKLEFKTPNNLSSQITPKFVRFNETNTLKPYGSESTASTFAELCSSVMMSSNSIKSFKTANSTFDSNSSLRTPTHMTTACAGNSLRFEEFDHPPSCQRSFHMPSNRCNNLTVTISKNPISNSANSKRVTYCRLPQIAPRIKITTSEEEEYDEESGSGDEDFIDAPKQPTLNHSHNHSHNKRVTRIDSSDSPNRLTIVSSTATTTTTTATTVVKKRSSPASNRRSRSSSQGRNQYHYHHVNQSNYSIDELRVDDETDDEEEPRKPIPKWAQSDALSHTSVRQAHKAIDFQQLFRAAGQTVRLEKVFPIVKNNFHVRSSSAEWPSPAAWRSNTLHQ